MKKYLLTLLLSVTASVVFCQQDSVLKNFKFRINNFRAVGFAISGGSYYDKSKEVPGTQKGTSSSGALGFSYYTNKSSDRILLTTISNIYSSFFTSKATNPNDINKSNWFSGALQFTGLNKWFAEKKFTELGADVQANLSENKSVLSTNPGPARNNQSQYSIAVNTGIGSGRLENITDMQNALWLNKELTAIKTLVRPLTPDELNELGQAITKGNNTRVLDSRKRTQFVLTTVDDYLQQKGLIAKTDINYFTNLNDILFFAINTPRLSGTEKYIRFTPAVSTWSSDYNQANIIDKNEHRFSTQSLLLTSGFGKYIPLNLVHQNNYGASVKLSAIFFDLWDRYFTNGVLNNEVKANSTLKQAGINLFFQHAVYPNTRTVIDINLQSEAGYYELEPESGFYTKTSLMASVNYFISYRTRFNISLGASYQKKNFTVNSGGLNELPENMLLYANTGVAISL